ncbi:putative transmembrane protein [Senna tora]|uniref:Putative transmembrane protein n=1 Tax=Senna tora TaxID=362788 RepID=A0A834WFU1_9FABA|nr:putative transmembrane protein [Senna tora]
MSCHCFLILVIRSSCAKVPPAYLLLGFSALQRIFAFPDLAKGGDREPLHVMSSYAAVFFMYTFVMDDFGVKPPLTFFEMAILSQYDLCPMQLTGNSWIFLANFELHCHHLQIPSTVKLLFYFY